MVAQEVKQTHEDEFTTIFELFYLLMVFKMELPVDIGAHSTLLVFQHMAELKMKALSRFAESTNCFVIKFKQLVFSNSSALQLERYVQLVLKLMQKMFTAISAE